MPPPWLSDRTVSICARTGRWNAPTLSPGGLRVSGLFGGLDWSANEGFRFKFNGSGFADPHIAPRIYLLCLIQHGRYLAIISPLANMLFHGLLDLGLMLTDAQLCRKVYKGTVSPPLSPPNEMKARLNRKLQPVQLRSSRRIPGCPRT